jgi:hypothetical protein
MPGFAIGGRCAHTSVCPAFDAGRPWSAVVGDDFCSAQCDPLSVPGFICISTINLPQAQVLKFYFEY